MDIARKKIDPVRMEQGGWIDRIPGAEDLRVQVRGIGNSDYRRLGAKLIAEAVEKAAPDAVSPEDEDRINGELLHQTILLGWEGLTENGSPVPFSAEAAKRYLFEPEYAVFRTWVQFAAARVAQRSRKAEETALGNS